MNAKVSLAAILLSCGIALAIAADKKGSEKSNDPCIAAYDKCAMTCTNERANCRARGSDEGTCENKYNKCVNACDKTRFDCQTKAAGGKKS
jgi:hypothetical protein